MLKLNNKELDKILDDHQYRGAVRIHIETTREEFANKATSKAVWGMRRLYLDYVKLSTRELCVTYGIELPLGDDHHDYGIISIIDIVLKSQNIEEYHGD